LARVGGGACQIIGWCIPGVVAFKGETASERAETPQFGDRRRRRGKTRNVSVNQIFRPI